MHLAAIMLVSGAIGCIAYRLDGWRGVLLACVANLTLSLLA